ncbi:MAG: UvrD-helicase domain-containing protein [Acidobacteria bacterium]|nr:UvrD-helicase domain-containing protein [Acidobacteriota bacterium]
MSPKNDRQLPLFGVEVQDGMAATSSSPPVLDLPDRAARTFAVDPRNNVVLEASAGTGKTSVLVGRYVNLLRAGVDPGNILAITFTRKAAAEMRGRIIRDMKAAARLSGDDSRRWRNLRDRLGDIAISTIDAFCLALLREFPLEADLDPGFELADETEVPRLVEEALDRALRICRDIARRDRDVALVFAHLKLPQIEVGLAHLLERRLVACEALDRYLQRGPADLDDVGICRQVGERLLEVLGSGRGGMQALIADGPIRHPRFALLVRELSALQGGSSNPSQTRQLVELVRDHFLTQSGKPRQRLSGYAPEHFVLPTASKRHGSLIVRLAPAVMNVLDAFARELNVVLARGVRRIFAIAAAEYRRTLEAHAVVDFSEVLARAIQLLAQMDEFSQSRYRLEARYHHVLVDEFQDTSRAQWRLVSSLIASWAEGMGVGDDAAVPPSIFVVGDRKQSIYRFRDADVSVMDRAIRDVTALRPQSAPHRSISSSFRSRAEILAFINDLFTALENAGDRSDAFRYGQSDRFPVPIPVSPADPGAAECLGVAAANRPDASAAAVGAEIARILAQEEVRDRDTGLARPMRPGDIAILFRSRESHRAFERALEERDIPTYVYKGLGFFDADEIRDVSALMRYLAQPHSRVRAAAFLRSRLVRVSDVAISRLGPGLVNALLGPEEGLALLDEEDRRVFACVRPALARWLPLVDRVTPAELLDQVFEESAYAYELSGPRVAQARENLKKMRGLIRRIQNRGYTTMARIADQIDLLSTGDEANAVIDAVNSVNLMTIHAAKGLEFPVVFVVNLAKGTGGPPLPIRLADPEGDNTAVSIGSLRSEADEGEWTRDREETKRLLYVAVTRARDRLYLASALKHGELKPARGSLAEVLPSSIHALLEQGGGDADQTTWRGPSATHRFRICRA